MLRSAVFVFAIATIPSGRALLAQEAPPDLRDRDSGIQMSMLGTYVRQGEVLVYPFFEWYADRNLEYKPSELGYGLKTDYRGRYRASSACRATSAARRSRSCSCPRSCTRTSRSCSPA